MGQNYPVLETLARTDWMVLVVIGAALVLAMIAGIIRCKDAFRRRQR